MAASLPHLALETRIAQLQREIDAALRRLEQGVYGRCIDCGLEIEPARLQARPSVARCIECQHRHEGDERLPHPRL